jgi:hypothetical protein
MKRLINDALMPLINDGLISLHRLEELIYIKDFIDRNTTRGYIDKGQAIRLKEKYGVMPSLITWGDYFQTEMATALLYNTDEEFMRAVHTVKFDVISSFEIFNEKNGEFFEWIDDQYLELVDENDLTNLSEEQEEIIHLKILKDYYVDMGIIDNFTLSEKRWYSTFNEAVAM